MLDSGLAPATVLHAHRVLSIELNSATDNPLVFPEGGAVPEDALATGRGLVISGGNFHGEPIALALDYAKLALAELGSISERRVAAPHETTATLAAIAAKRAIATAGLAPDDVDVIVVATLTPDYPMPSTATLVKEAIGNSAAAAFDIAAACSGLVSNPNRHVLNASRGSLMPPPMTILMFD